MSVAWEPHDIPDEGWQPHDIPDEPGGVAPSPDQNAHLMQKSVNVGGFPKEDFEKNMAIHLAKREANPLYKSIMQQPAPGAPDHPHAHFARIATPKMLDAMDALKSITEHFDPKLEKSRAFAQKAMDLMAAGTYSQAGTFLQAAKMAKGEATFSDLIHKGILAGPEVLLETGPGKDSRTFNSDVLAEAGVTNPWLKYGGGFALDIAVNPFNLLKGAGLSRLGKAAEMYTAAKAEERVMGTPLPDFEALAKNGNREAKIITNMLAAGKEDALNLGTTTAEKVEKGHYLFPGVQIPGMKRINLASLKFQMDESTWAKLAEDHPDLAGKIKAGEPIPKDVMKSLFEIKGDEALQGVTLHPSTRRLSIPIPVPDIHNPVWEAQGLPKGAAVPLAKAMTATNRYLREFNPELLKPGVSGAANLYGKARKGMSSLMGALDATFNRYPQPVIEGKLGDPRIYDDTVRIMRMALNQKGDMTREMVDALYDLQTQAGGDKGVVLRMARAAKMDKAAPDTYRALETMLSSRVPDEEFGRVRSSLEEATRVVTPNRDLPNEWELRHFGTNDETAIRQQVEDAVAAQRGEWGADRRQTVASALESGALSKADAQATLREIDAQEAAIARDAPDKLAAVDALERNLQKHRDNLHSLTAAERQAAYSGTPEAAGKWGQQAAELRQSLGENGWGETYRKIFGKPIEGVLPEPTGQPRMAFMSATDRLRAAQDDAARIEADLRSAAEEQRALAAAMEAAPSPSNEALVRLEKANQRAAGLQAQMQQRVKMISDLEDRVRNEGDTNAMIQKVQAGLDKQHQVETADEIAQLEKHPVMSRPSTTLKDVRDERARLLKERPATFRDESFAPEGQTIGDYLKARYGDDPEYYKAVMEQKAAAFDRAEFRKGAAKADREAAKGLREAARTTEPAPPEKPSLVAPAWRFSNGEITSAPGKTWHDFTLHPPDIQARIESGEGVETGFVDATGKFFTREEVAQQGLKMTPPAAKANRPAIGKPRVPLKGFGLPVPAPKPVASAVDLTSFGMNNPPDLRAFIANREAGGSQLGLAMTGAQGLRGELPEPGTAGMHEYQAWLSKTMENPTVAADLTDEVSRDLIRLSGEGWAKRRAMRDMIDAWISTEDGRQKIVKFMAEYYPHVKDVVSAYSSPLAVVLGGAPKGSLGTPGFATARKFRDVFDDINQANKLAHGKGLLVDDVMTTLFNRAAESIHFQVHNDMLNRMLSSMGLSGREIQTALAAEGIHEIPNARAAANIVNSHFWMRKMGYPQESIARVEALNKKLYDLGVWNATGNPADPTAVEGVMNRLAAIAREGDFREAKGITFGEGGEALSDLPDGIKSRLKRAVGVTTDAELIDPKAHVPGTSLKDAAAKLIKDINRTIKDRDALAPSLRLFMTKGDLARLADYPDFVNVMSVARGAREADLGDAGKSLVNLDPATIPNFKDLDKYGVNYYLIPDQLAHDINGGIKTFLDDSGPRGLFQRWAHGATNIWKQGVTTVWPEFHIRNALTNMYQLHVYAGIDDPALFWQARKIQLGMPGHFVRDDNSILTHGDVMRLAQKYGVAGHGYFGEDVKAIMDPRKGGIASGKIKAAASAATSVGRDMGRFIEENARIGGFMHYLKQGMSPYAASMKVKQFLFDYGELSPTERNFFRLVIPFYSWMRKNLPLQVSQILRNPATMSVSRDIQHAVSGLVNGQELTPEQFANLPEWLKPMLPILYKNRKDKQKVTALAGKVSPTSDPMQLGQDIDTHGLLGGTAAYLWGAANPLLKEPAEQIMGKDLESGRTMFENPIHKTPLHLPSFLVGPTARTFDLPAGKGIVMVPERAGHALQNLRGVSFMNSTMKDTAADTTATQNAETVLKNLIGLRSYDVDFQKNYQIEGRKDVRDIKDMAPIDAKGRINYDSPLIKEILSRNRKSSEGVPPMTLEERKAFNERVRKAQEKFQQQRAQRP